jgi:hypothetical protein
MALVTFKLFFVLTAILAEIGCGGGSGLGIADQGAPLSANWQFYILPNHSKTPPQSVSGFLLQNKDSIAGNLAVAPTPVRNCSGVAPLTGSVSGTNVTLSINEFGTVLSLLGTLSSDSSSMTGSYTASDSVCGTPTGTWTAVQVKPLNGSFVGSLTSTSTNSPLFGNTYQVSGTLSQGDNTGSSNTDLVGFIAVTNYPCISTADVRGLISGQNVTLSFYGSDGSLLGQVPQAVGNFATAALVNGTTTVCAGSNSACGAAQDNPASGYVIANVAKCQGVTFPQGGQESGTMTLTFP